MNSTKYWSDSTLKTASKESGDESQMFEKNLASLISKMYETRNKDGDFSIKCGGAKIPCHKLILAASSQVFKVMIRSKMKESNQGEMAVDSFSHKTVTEMIHFFYMKNIPIDKNIKNILGNVDYFDLLKAADFFDVPLLKKVCEHSLISELRRDSVLESYKTAKLYNAEVLMKEAREMIIGCKAEIMRGNGWKQKLKELNDPDLMIEMLDNSNPRNSKYQAGVGGTWEQPQQSRYEENLYLNEQVEDEEIQCTTEVYDQYHYQHQNMSYPYPYQNMSSRSTVGKIERKARKSAVPHVAVSNSAHTALCKEVLDDMLSNFASLYNDEDTADLSCYLNQEKVHMHKQFIKLYSEPLLNKILANNQITKIEKDVLKFLYTGEIGDYALKAKELIEMAHTFKIPLLRSYCEGTLISTLTVGNVLDRFIIASRTDSQELRKKTLELMKRENKNIRKTDNWRQLVKDNVDIVFELIMEGWSLVHPVEPVKVLPSKPMKCGRM